MKELSFKEKVFEAVRLIPEGQTRSYGQIAEQIGCPGGARAVGNALHKNSSPFNAPCHRVVHADGSLTDAYVFGGKDVQRKRLESEGVIIRNNKVVKKM